MARTVVIGGGFGGMASAARLAKLGHDVTLVEAAPALGGALTFVEQDGFRWDAGPANTLLPAVVRDLFRKSGRAMEKEIELVAVEPIQQHRFDDERRTQLDLPGGSRGDQLAAVEAALGGGAGERWVSYVDDFVDVWDALRRDWMERPYSPEHASKETRQLLATRVSMHKYVAKAFKDSRLRQLALHRVILDGHDPRNVPAWLGLTSYLEQSFGSWTVPGGMGSLTPVLAARLGTRGVTVQTGTTARDIVMEAGKLVGVSTDYSDLDAEQVVVAIDPRRLPALARHVERTMPAIPATACYLGLVGDVPDLPHEVILHGDPTLVLRTNGTAPDGARAWTLLGAGRLAEDIVVALARGGINVRDQVEVRIDRSPRQLVEEWNGSPNGVLWQGRGTLRNRLGPRTPLDAVYLAGAHGTPGSGLPFVGLSAALVAQCIGPA